LQLVPVRAGDLEHVGAELEQVVPLVVRAGMFVPVPDKAAAYNANAAVRPTSGPSVPS